MVARMVVRMALDVGDDFEGVGEVGDEGGCEDGGDESAEDYNYKGGIIDFKLWGFCIQKKQNKQTLVIIEMLLQLKQAKKLKSCEIKRCKTCKWWQGW